MSKLRWKQDEAVKRNSLCVEGWPAADHEDEDDDSVKAKLASGLYEEVGPARRSAPAPEDKEE
jgi:hypothetical protein